MSLRTTTSQTVGPFYEIGLRWLYRDNLAASGLSSMLVKQGTQVGMLRLFNIARFHELMREPSDAALRSGRNPTFLKMLCICKIVPPTFRKRRIDSQERLLELREIGTRGFHNFSRATSPFASSRWIVSRSHVPSASSISCCVPVRYKESRVSPLGDSGI